MEIGYLTPRHTFYNFIKYMEARLKGKVQHNIIINCQLTQVKRISLHVYTHPLQKER
jgi:hypothetical protein